jgi:hypothetical protein
MQSLSNRTAENPSVVIRPPHWGAGGEQYLVQTPSGEFAWTPDLGVATTFESMKEATRAALRLPSTFRAFGMPLRSELQARDLH